MGEGPRYDGLRWAAGQLVLRELSSPFVPGTLSEDLTPMDAKELMCSAGLGRNLSSLDLTKALQEKKLCPVYISALCSITKSQS